MYQKLAFYDCIGNIAFSLMLKDKGVVTEEEYALLIESCKELTLLNEHAEGLIQSKEKNPFKIIDKYLNEKIKGLKAKLETGRSLQDRFLLDMRLLLRIQLLDMIESIVLIAELICSRECDFFEFDLGLLKTAFTLLDQLPYSSTDSNPSTDWQQVASILGLKPKIDDLFHRDYRAAKIDSSILFALVQSINDIGRVGILDKDSSILVHRKAETLSHLLSGLMNRLSSDHSLDSVELADFTFLGIDMALEALKIVQDSRAKSFPHPHEGLFKAYLLWTRQERRQWEERCNRLLHY